MEWIRENSNPEDTFAINAEFWRPAAPHGEDGGYWIPYFTQRHTTAAVILISLAQRNEWIEMVDDAKVVLEYEDDLSKADELFEHGIDYVYVGSSEVTGGRGLNPAELSNSSGVEVAFQSNSVWIFRLVD